MTTRVPFLPFIPSTTSTSQMRAAKPVRGSQWQKMGITANWLLGRGGSLVVAGACGPSPGSASSDDSRFRFYVWPRQRTGSTDHLHSRIWVVECWHENTEDVEMTVDLHDSSTQFDVVVPASDTNPGFEFLEDPSSDDGEISIEFTIASSSTPVHIQQVCCYEVPRTVLYTTVGTRGVRETSMIRGAPILENSATVLNKVGPEALAFQEAAAASYVRRNAVFNWASGTGIPFTNTSYPGSANVLPALQRVQARLLEENTTGTLNVAVRMHVDNAANIGRVRILSQEAADSLELASNSTTPEWRTGTIDVNSDELGRKGHIRGSSDPAEDDTEVIRIEARTTAGTCYVTGISIGE